MSYHMLPKSSCIQSPILSHIPTVQRSLLLLVLFCSFNTDKEMPFKSLLLSTTHLMGCRAHFEALHFVWSLQLKVFSFSWTFTKQWLPRENWGSILEPCPASPAGLNVPVLVTKNCGKSLWGFQNLFHVSKSESKDYPTIRVALGVLYLTAWMLDDSLIRTFLFLTITEILIHGEKTFKESQLSQHPRWTFALVKKM